MKVIRAGVDERATRVKVSGDKKAWVWLGDERNIRTRKIKMDTNIDSLIII